MRRRLSTESLARASARRPWLAIGLWSVLLLVAGFMGFAAGDRVMSQGMGFGAGVAVLLDATIVRSILVSAAMRLLGDWNWYLPKVLRWLPDLRVEAPERAQPEAT